VALFDGTDFGLAGLGLGLPVVLLLEGMVLLAGGVGLELVEFVPLGLGKPGATGGGPWDGLGLTVVLFPGGTGFVPVELGPLGAGKPGDTDDCLGVAGTIELGST
jgi:hypothetical protein